MNIQNFMNWKNWVDFEKTTIQSHHNFFLKKKLNTISFSWNSNKIDKLPTGKAKNVFSLSAKNFVKEKENYSF